MGLAASAKYANRIAKLGGLADNIAPLVDDADQFVDNAVGAIVGKIDDADGILYYNYADGHVKELPTIDKRLKQMHEILTDEAIRLRNIPRGKASPEDLKRLRRINKQSCAIAAVNANRAAKGEKVVPVSLADDLPELNTRSIMRMVDGDTPVSVKNLDNLDAELGKHLREPNSRGILVIHNKESDVVSHAINVENVDGVIWLLEANEGVAVPLGWQRAGKIGIERIYPIEEIGALHFINTP